METAKDFLTRCYTRESLLPYLKKMEQEYALNKQPFSVLIMDVDHFKSFNDKYGHMYGDEVLKYFSSSMRLDLEDEENAPFRFGGDEFITVFPNKTPSDAYRLATRLRKNIRTRSCLIKGRQISITFSGGIAGYPTDTNTIEDVLDKADKALYYSKNHGRGRITKYSDLGSKEIFQIAALLLILSFIGTLLYHYRDPLSNQFNKATAPILKIVFEPKPRPPASSNKDGLISDMTEVRKNPVVPKNNPVVPALPAGPEISKVYLESGRTIQGIIRSEDEDGIKVEVGLQEGKGILQIKKSQIVRIETGNKPPRKFQ